MSFSLPGVRAPDTRRARREARAASLHPGFGAAMATTFHNFIGGRWVPAKSGRTFTNLNPATGEPLGEFPDSGPDDVDAAVQAARAAMRAWQLTPAPKR